MPTLRYSTAAALLISSAAVASIAAPGLAAEETETRSRGSGQAAPSLAEANAAPVAEDDVATVTTGGSTVITVLDNDYDPDATSTSVLTLTRVVEEPVMGATTVAENTIKYAAHGDFVGTDTFTYEVSDGEQADQATVTITVTDAPNGAPTTAQDRARTRWGRSVVVDVTENDSDPEGERLSVIGTRRPDHGRAEVVRGKVLYTPRGKYLGQVQIPYTIQDERGAAATGTLTVQVYPLFDVTLKKYGNAVALRAMSVKGAVSTRLEGPVVASLQRWNDGRWKTVAARRVRGDNDFTLRWRAAQPGRAMLRLTARWDGGNKATTPRTKLHIDGRFDPEVRRISAKDVPHTWRPGCPVGPSGLRAIRMNYWDYRGRLQRGTLIAASWVTQDFLAVFRRAFETKFMIKKMYPVDRYGGDDKRAMRAGNTSAFNCRHVTGNPYRMSQHSYGNAIDINTFENPYVTGSRVYPPKAAVPYYYRRENNRRDPGVITSRSSIARALWAQGWAWGARWSLPDYQHWSSNGG